MIDILYRILSLTGKSFQELPDFKNSDFKRLSLSHNFDCFSSMKF